MSSEPSIPMPIVGPSIQFAQPRERTDEELAQAAHDRSVRFQEGLKWRNPYVGVYETPAASAPAEAAPRPEADRDDDKEAAAAGTVPVLLGPCLQCTAVGSSRCSLLGTQSLDRSPAPCTRCARVSEPHCLQATRDLSRPYGSHRRRYRWAVVPERPDSDHLPLCDQDVQLVFPRDPAAAAGLSAVRGAAEALLQGEASYVARSGTLLSESDQRWLALPAWHANDHWENRIDPDFRPARWDARLRAVQPPNQARLAALVASMELTLEERKTKRLAKAAEGNLVVRPDSLSTVQEDEEGEEEWVMPVALSGEGSVEEEEVAISRTLPAEGRLEEERVPRPILNGDEGASRIGQPRVSDKEDDDPFSDFDLFG